MLVGFCGPSAVGKTTIMRSLANRLGWNFVRVATTRPTRQGETEKFQVSPDDYVLMERDGAFWCSNIFFGNSYGTLKLDIEASASTQQNVYMLDWPITKIQLLGEVANLILFIVPASEDQLIDQAIACGRAERLKEIVEDYRSNYSAEKLDILSNKVTCPVTVVVNYKSGKEDSLEDGACRFIQTEILRLSTT